MKIDVKNPIVFLDLAHENEKIGRVIIELFKNDVPKAAENFRALCTGEKGIGKNGKPLHFKGSIFHKIVPRLMMQGGDIINFDGSGGESIYGPCFEDENLKTLHHDEGLLSMVNAGRPNSNSSQFVITLSSCPQLDHTNVVFGKVLKGMGVVHEVSLIPTNEDKPLEKIHIIDCGEITGCDNWGLEDNDNEDVYCPFPEDWDAKTSQIDYNHVIEIIEKIKAVGNIYFSAKKFSTAENKYKKALRYYEWMLKQDEIQKDEKKVKEIKIVILLNLATVKIRQAKYKDALNLCNQVLIVDKNNNKALFRRGQAHVGLHEYELGLSYLKQALELNPGNKDVLKEIEKVKKMVNSYLMIEKQACKRMFQIN